MPNLNRYCGACALWHDNGTDHNCLAKLPWWARDMVFPKTIRDYSRTRHADGENCDTFQPAEKEEQ
jgi:hypothetical protein